MNDGKVIVSVSMLISGRETMFRSLASLQPLREAFPCEIILVDTGCTSEQRQRAEAYADKILDYEWCGDFSEARNVGLKAATGEWFLYMDDDEWFDDPKQIITFFLSGEYQSYQSAVYTVRNYLDTAGARYIASYPVRLAERTPELRFVGKVHEYLKPAGEPRKVLTDFVHHYGYAFQSREEKERHAERNIPPLLEMCRENPGNPTWAAQLAQEYFSLGNREKVLEVCRQGLHERHIRKESANDHPVSVGVLYSYILLCLELSGRYAEEEQWLAKALEEKLSQLELMQPTMAYYCIRGVVACAETGKDEACRTFLKKYLSYYDRLHEDAAAVGCGTAAVVCSVFDRENVLGVIRSGLPSVIRLYDDGFAAELFDRADRMTADEGGERNFPDLLECRILWEEKRRGTGTEEKHRRLEDMARQLFAEAACALMAIRQEAWNVLERQKIRMEPLFLELDFLVWRRVLERWCGEADLEEIREWENRISGWKSCEDIRYALFDVKCAEAYLRAETESSLPEREKRFWEYADAVEALYRPYIREELFSEGTELLPDELQLASGLKELQKCRQMSDARGALKKIQECFFLYAPLDEALGRYAKLLKEEIRKELAEQEAAEQELEKLAVSLKIVAKQYMERGEWKAAEEILRQILACVPEEKEAEKMLLQINGN